MVKIMETTTMNTTTFYYRLLELIAVSGEFPSDNLKRMGIGESYGEKLVTKLKEDKLIKTYYRDKLRGYRLTSRGKKFLLAENSERFFFYLSGASDTNQPRSDYARRLRLHQASRTYVLFANAEIPFFRDRKPALFSGVSPDTVTVLPRPVFYHSREIKELGNETTKINNSRTIGILFADTCIYAVFYTGNSILKWEYKTEIRVKALLAYHASQGILRSWYRHDTPIHALLIGNDMETAIKLMTSTGGYRHSLFTLDTSFEYFHFIPDSHAGEILVKLLCDSVSCRKLAALLLSDLDMPDAGLGLEHDATTKEGNPVLLAFDFDMLRISRFLTGLKLYQCYGHLICFDFQEAALLLYCGNTVTISIIDLEKFERRFFT